MNFTNLTQSRVAVYIKMFLLVSIILYKHYNNINQLIMSSYYYKLSKRCCSPYDNQQNLL